MFTFIEQFKNRNWQQNCQSDIVRFEDKHDIRSTLSASVTGMK